MILVKVYYDTMQDFILVNKTMNSVFVKFEWIYAVAGFSVPA